MSVLPKDKDKDGIRYFFFTGIKISIVWFLLSYRSMFIGAAVTSLVAWILSFVVADVPDVAAA